VLGVGGIVQPPLDLAADGDQLVQVLGRHRQPDRSARSWAWIAPPKPMSTRTVSREVATSTSFASSYQEESK
jgi:hypothetical protein